MPRKGGGGGGNGRGARGQTSTRKAKNAGRNKRGDAARAEAAAQAHWEADKEVVHHHAGKHFHVDEDERKAEMMAGVAEVGKEGFEAALDQLTAKR